MKSIVIGMCIACLVAGGLWAQNTVKAKKLVVDPPTWSVAVEKGAKWLASVQGADGGWGQDGGETSYIRQTEHLESTGNDVANTAVAALALLEAGQAYRPNVDRALDFILKKVEISSKDGLAVTDQQGTQIQRKLGPYIDTFLTSMLLARIDGTMAKADQNARVRHALEKCVAKIERNQKSDGSWNVAGGWAPVLGTSLASRSLFEAQQKGVRVDAEVTASAERYAVTVMSGTNSSVGTVSASAGVPLYQSAQALEQLSRTEADRTKNASQIAGIQGQISQQKFVDPSGEKSSFRISTSATV